MTWQMGFAAILGLLAGNVRWADSPGASGS